MDIDVRDPNLAPLVACGPIRVYDFLADTEQVRQQLSEEMGRHPGTPFRILRHSSDDPYVPRARTPSTDPAMRALGAICWLDEALVVTSSKRDKILRSLQDVSHIDRILLCSRDAAQHLSALYEANFADRLDRLTVILPNRAPGVGRSASVKIFIVRRTQQGGPVTVLGPWRYLRTDYHRALAGLGDASEFSWQFAYGAPW